MSKGKCFFDDKSVQQYLENLHQKSENEKMSFLLTSLKIVFQLIAGFS